MLRGSHIVGEGGGGMSWDGEVDSGRVTSNIFLKGGYILGGRGKFSESRTYKLVEKGSIFWEGALGRYWEGRTYKLVEKGGIFWEGG